MTMHDTLAVAVSCLLILAYYLYLGRRTRRSPLSSVHAVNAGIRERWVDMIRRSGKLDILAIQTIRNSVMAANFMATTAILLIIGLLNIGDKIGLWVVNRQPILLIEPAELWQIKLGLLLLDFAVAFYCFSMAIRLFNHAGYIINLPDDASTDGEIYQQTCAYLNRAGSYYAIGTRSFFFSLPIVLWFFGPYFLVLATFGLIAGLTLFDRAPS